MHTITRAAGLWPLALAFGLVSCGGGGDGGTGPTDGAILVAISTTGTNLDPDGYAIALAGDPQQSVGINGVLTISNVEAGDWLVPLFGVAANCAVTGQNPVTVTVVSGETAEAEFAVVCGAPPPVLSGRIAFQSSRAGDSDIYSANADGTDLQRLTASPADDFEPDWSPDGSRLAFTSERDGNMEVYVMNADGSDQVRLTIDPEIDNLPDWSPDGARIAFTTGRDGNGEVYVMNPDGTDPVNLTNEPADDGHAAWSHDGTRIAFQTVRDGGAAEVYVMNADGSNVVNLTNHPADDGRPAWSPDDQRIAFISNRDGNYEIYVMNADGSAPLRLTNHPELDAFPEWSPDGQYIAFRSDRAGNLEVFVMEADGSGLFNWTNHPSSDCHPRWTAAEGTTVRALQRAGGQLAAFTEPAQVAPVKPSVRASVGSCLGE